MTPEQIQILANAFSQVTSAGLQVEGNTVSINFEKFDQAKEFYDAVSRIIRGPKTNATAEFEIANGNKGIVVVQRQAENLIGRKATLKKDMITQWPYGPALIASAGRPVEILENPNNGNVVVRDANKNEFLTRFEDLEVLD